MTNEIDELMSLLDEDLVSFVSDPGNTDKIIDYMRKARANHIAGVKPKKGGGEKQEIDLVKMGLVQAPEKIRRI